MHERNTLTEGGFAHAWQLPIFDAMGVPMYGGRFEDFCSFFCQNFPELGQNNFCISATGAHGIVIAKQQPDFRIVLQRSFLNLPDGKPIRWLARGAPHRMEQCRGADVLRNIVQRTARTTIKHFLCGTSEETLAKLKQNIENRWGNQNVVGTYAPPYCAVEAYNYKDIASCITASGAQIVWIGLGTPKQEQFALTLSAHLHVTALFTIGAAFDFHAGNLTQAPTWIRHAPIPLEWLYRMLQNPRKLLGRYLHIVPCFLYYYILSLLKKR